MLSRVTHESHYVWQSLRCMIIEILQEYPKQALWLFASVVHSSDGTRKLRAEKILKKVKVSVEVYCCILRSAQSFAVEHSGCQTCAGQCRYGKASARAVQQAKAEKKDGVDNGG